LERLTAVRDGLSPADGPSHAASRGAIIDVSVTIRPRMPIYPGNPGVRIAQSLERGDPVNVASKASSNVLSPSGAGGIRTGSLAPVGSMCSSSTMHVRPGEVEAYAAAGDLVLRGGEAVRPRIAGAATPVGWPVST
jgi:hypothetical protein